MIVYIQTILLLTVIQTNHVIASYKQESERNFHNNHDESNHADHHNMYGYSDQTTDESKLRLAMLVDEKIDTNKDGLVQLDELARWIRKCRGKFTHNDALRQWQSFADTTNGLTWDEYAKQEYEHLESLMKDAIDTLQLHDIKKSYDSHKRRDRRRWQIADVNHDDKLSLQEFINYLHPEQSPTMKNVLISERFETFDNNHDDRISLEEYISNLESEESVSRVPEIRDAWLKNHRDRFSSQLDLDKSNYLDAREFERGLNSKEFADSGVEEAQHLMTSADINRDHRLTKEEILAAYDEFISSYATDFGEALQTHGSTRHDEL